MLPPVDSSVLHRFDQASQYEWLETNGLGGYASSTLIGAMTRRYHGLLVTATRPPVQRVVLLSKLDEALQVGEHRYELGANKYQGSIYPQGYIFLQSYQQGLYPEFTYQLPEVTLKKSILAVHGQPTTLITYEVVRAEKPFQMSLLPQYAPRDYHSLSHANGQISGDLYQDGDIFHTQAYPDSPALYMKVPGAHFETCPDWYYQLEYQEELNRGMAGHEDLFSPGRFWVELKEGDRLGIMVSAEHPGETDAWTLKAAEISRRKQLIEDAEVSHPMLQQLALSADQFIVKRGDSLKTIIAGYHWFTDWGRDTMISLPGLCLATRRFEDARKILEAFAEAADMGMIPNRFPDNGEPPLYNTVDGTLWYFIAVYKYLLHTKDHAFVQEVIMPVLEDILDWHMKGTRFGIRMDEDGLLEWGADGYCLTWMDAKAGDWVVTPRDGKAVEINALWYNAWKIYAELLRISKREEELVEAEGRAEQIRLSFVEKFWNPQAMALFDVVNGAHKDASIRPNQIFAISLPFPLLDVNQAYQVLDRVERDLLTPVGLRSLSPSDAGYRAYYQGDTYARDGAYHQGTTWSWLIGPYMDALIKVRGGWGKEMARQIIEGMETHLITAGVGSVSEIFDGEEPNIPRGCIAQAWGVAELLRVAKEYELFPSESTQEGGSVEVPARRLISFQAQVNRSLD